MIDVLSATVDSVLDLGSPYASEPDLAASARRRSPELQRQTLAGRVALRMLASWRLGRPLEQAGQVRITRTCPDCAEPHGQPTSPELALSSSTTHGRRVLVAVGDPSEALGVDIEAVPDALWDGFDEFTLHEGERARLRGLPGGERADELSGAAVEARIALWSAKEAALKAAGVGLRIPPSAVRLQAPGGGDSPAWRSVHVEPPAAAALTSAGPLFVCEVAAGSGVRASLASTARQVVRVWTMPEFVRALRIAPQDMLEEWDAQR